MTPPKVPFTKVCTVCKKSVQTFSNRLKICQDCKDKTHTVACAHCKKDYIRNDNSRICKSCKDIKVSCSCGCGLILPAYDAHSAQVFTIRYKRGHARRNKHNTESHNLAISEANKGQHTGTPWNKGKTGLYKVSEETKQLMRNIAKLKGFGKWMLGRKLPQCVRDLISKTNTGRIVSESTKTKISAKNAGEGNGMWCGGLSRLPYPVGFRPSLKKVIKQRDSFTCQLCGSKTDLAIHHIDYEKYNLSEDNLITLCNSCNSVVNTHRSSWKNYFNNRRKVNVS